MCYFVDLRVVLEKDSPATRAQVHPPQLSSRLCCSGSFPNYLITTGMCACDLVHEKGKWVEGLPEVVQHFLALPVVKRVEVVWYWASEDTEAPHETKLSVNEFLRLNQEHKLVAGVRYRLSPQRWA